MSEQDYQRVRGKEVGVIKEGEYEEMQKRLIQNLLKFGASPEVENERGEKPLRLCIENDNLTGIQLLLNEIPFDLPHRSYIYYLTKIGCLGH